MLSPTRGREALLLSSVLLLCSVVQAPDYAPAGFCLWALIAAVYALPWLAGAAPHHLRLLGQAGLFLAAGALLVKGLRSVEPASERLSLRLAALIELACGLIGVASLVVGAWVAGGWLFLAVHLGSSPRCGLRAEAGRALMIAVPVAIPAAPCGAVVGLVLQHDGVVPGALPWIGLPLSGALTGIAVSVVVGALVRARAREPRAADPAAPG